VAGKMSTEIGGRSRRRSCAAGSALLRTRWWERIVVPRGAVAAVAVVAVAAVARPAVKVAGDAGAAGVVAIGERTDHGRDWSRSWPRS